MERLKRLARRVLGFGAATNRQQLDRQALFQRLPKASICAEIGVFKGDFSAQILAAVRPARLHLIDPWRYEVAETYALAWYGGDAGGSQQRMDEILAGVRARFRRQIEAGTVVLHRASSAQAAGGFPDHYFDWVYIDGNHRYEFVREDLEAYGRKVKPGGYLAGDDYGVPGWWEDGVTRAVDEAVEQGALRKVRILGTQYLLQKP